jgi:hypothetical protein
MVFNPTVVEFANATPQDQMGVDILKRQSKMETIREFYERGLWQDITRFVNPRRAQIRIDDQHDDKGQNLGKDVYDGSPLGALNTWSDGMQGFLISNRWFKSEMDNPQLNKVDSVRNWLQVYDQKMYSAFDRGNFYAVLPEWFRDAGSIGTATLFTQEEIGTGRIAHLSVHPREVFVAENMFGEVDTVHRKFMMTARQAVQMFNEEKETGQVSDTIKSANETEPDKQYQFIHAVFPNTDRVPGKKTSANKKFRSVYVEAGEGDGNKTAFINRDSGFDINPYAVWRFRKNSDEIYGRSPAADSLTEVFSLNQIGMTLLQAAHKSVDPALNVPVEMRGRVRIEPHGYNYYEKNDRLISPIGQGINYPIGIDQQERLQKSMEDKFRVEFFRAFIGRQGEATAAEIFAIKGEQAGLMSAQVDRLYIEGLRKIFDIVSDIEDRRGVFSEEAGMPPMPQEIIDEGGQINFILTGPLAQAQRRIRELNPINEVLDALGPAAAVLGPEMLDIINRDELSEIIVESGSYPQRAINSKERRKEIRTERAEALELEKQQQFMLEAAKAAPGLAKAPEPGSPGETIAEAV